MRKEGKNGAMGKVIAKQNLPLKLCVVCNRSFTWRKKWERVWDEVTTCSKSCNAKRKAIVKQGNPIADVDATNPTAESSASFSEDETWVAAEQEPWISMKMLRKQHKEAVKAQKREKRAKREGNAPHLGRKPCDLCSKQVDLLVRCTVDESQQYKMVCGKCWRSVSGGVPDGSPGFPQYNYGGLWKNRNASLKKRVGSGPTNTNAKKDSVSSLLDEIENSLQLEEEEEES